MRTLFYALAGIIGFLIIIVFFQNLNAISAASIKVLGSSQMMMSSGTIVFFSAILGAIAAMLAAFGVYYDQIFGKKETVWSGTQKENIATGESKDEWSNTEW